MGLVQDAEQASVSEQTVGDVDLPAVAHDDPARLRELALGELGHVVAVNREETRSHSVVAEQADRSEACQTS